MLCFRYLSARATVPNVSPPSVVHCTIHCAGKFELVVHAILGRYYSTTGAGRRVSYFHGLDSTR